MYKDIITAICCALLSIVLAILLLFLLRQEEKTQQQQANETIIYNGDVYELIKDSNGDIVYIERGKE